MTFDEVRAQSTASTQPNLSPSSTRKRRAMRPLPRAASRPNGCGFDTSSVQADAVSRLLHSSVSTAKTAGDRLLNRLAMRAAINASPADQPSRALRDRGVDGRARHFEVAFGDSPLLFPSRQSPRLAEQGGSLGGSPSGYLRDPRRGTVRPRVEDPWSPPLPPAKRRSTLAVKEVSTCTTCGVSDTAHPPSASMYSS